MCSSRSVPCWSRGWRARRLAAGAAALVLALALAAPVQAAPIGQDGGLLSSILAKVARWFEGLQDLDPGLLAGDRPAPSPLPAGCSMDPSGSTCTSKDDTDPDSPDTRDQEGTSSG